MAFNPVDVTDGTSVKTAHSPSEVNQALWKGWWLTAAPPAPQGPSSGLLHDVEAQLAWLLSDPSLAQSFGDWYLAHGGGGATVPPVLSTATVVDQGGYVTFGGGTAVDHGTYATVTEDARVTAVDRGTYCAVTIAP